MFVKSVSCVVFEIEQQACPECENGEGLAGVDTVLQAAPFVECWRCDGHGLVEVYDDFEPKIKVLDHNRKGEI